MIVSSLTSSKCGDIGENHLIECIYDPAADLRRSTANLLIYLQWYIRLVTAISRQL